MTTFVLHRIVIVALFFTSRHGRALLLQGTSLAFFTSYVNTMLPRQGHVISDPIRASLEECADMCLHGYNSEVNDGRRDIQYSFGTGLSQAGSNTAALRKTALNDKFSTYTIVSNDIEQVVSHLQKNNDQNRISDVGFGTSTRDNYHVRKQRFTSPRSHCHAFEYIRDLGVCLLVNVNSTKHESDVIKDLKPAIGTNFYSLNLADNHLCEKEFCQNGGTCMQISDRNVNFVCCLGFTGSRCDTKIDDCWSMPCLFGGVCVEESVGYECHCPQGVVGKQCNKFVGDCYSMPCFNNGSCIPSAKGYHCACVKGFTGANCEYNVNECFSSPCRHGLCIDRINDYECICMSGYTGANCEIDTSVASCVRHDCKFGTCAVNASGSYCQCFPGFEGYACDINIDECKSSPCVHGSCDDHVNTFSCNCNTGYVGRHCDLLSEDPCKSNPCVHGFCSVTNDGFSCICEQGFTGKECENALSACDYLCKNGFCVNTFFAEPVCICLEGYSGKYCATPKRTGCIEAKYNCAVISSSSVTPLQYPVTVQTPHILTSSPLTFTQVTETKGQAPSPVTITQTHLTKLSMKTPVTQTYITKSSMQTLITQTHVIKSSMETPVTQTHVIKSSVQTTKHSTIPLLHLSLGPTSTQKTSLIDISPTTHLMPDLQFTYSNTPNHHSEQSTVLIPQTKKSEQTTVENSTILDNILTMPNEKQTAAVKTTPRAFTHSRGTSTIESTTLPQVFPKLNEKPIVTKTLIKHNLTRTVAKDSRATSTFSTKIITSADPKTYFTDYTIVPELISTESSTSTSNFLQPSTQKLITFPSTPSLAKTTNRLLDHLGYSPSTPSKSYVSVIALQTVPAGQTTVSDIRLTSSSSQTFNSFASTQDSQNSTAYQIPKTALPMDVTKETSVNKSARTDILETSTVAFTQTVAQPKLTTRRTLLTVETSTMHRDISEEDTKPTKETNEDMTEIVTAEAVVIGALFVVLVAVVCIGGIALYRRSRSGSVYITAPEDIPRKEDSAVKKRYSSRDIYSDLKKGRLFKYPTDRYTRKEESSYTKRRNPVSKRFQKQNISESRPSSTACKRYIKSNVPRTISANSISRSSGDNSRDNSDFDDVNTPVVLISEPLPGQIVSQPGYKSYKPGNQQTSRASLLQNRKAMNENSYRRYCDVDSTSIESLTSGSANDNPFFRDESGGLRLSLSPFHRSRTEEEFQSLLEEMLVVDDYKGYHRPGTRSEIFHISGTETGKSEA